MYNTAIWRAELRTEDSSRTTAPTTIGGFNYILHSASDVLFCFCFCFCNVTLYHDCRDVNSSRLWGRYPTELFNSWSYLSVFDVRVSVCFKKCISVDINFVTTVILTIYGLLLYKNSDSSDTFLLNTGNHLQNNMASQHCENLKSQTHATSLLQIWIPECTEINDGFRMWTVISIITTYTIINLKISLILNVML